MKIAVFFPGQGSQKPGMGQEFYESNEVFKKAFDKCDSKCDIDLKKACFEGEGLESTSVTQPALHAVNISTYKMIESMGVKCDVFAGLSLGEYSALAAAECVDYADTTKIVSIRGNLMESAVPQGVASMTAVIGLPHEDVIKAIADIDNVWITNLNSPGQIIIGGTLEALDIADVKIKEAGAKIVKRLNVAGPFHTPLLKEAGDKLRDALEQFDIIATDKTVYANVTGKKYNNSDDIKDLLARQVSLTVNWVDIMNSVIENVDIIIECGPGNVLSKLAKKQLKQLNRECVKIISVNSIGALSEVKELL